MTKEEVMTAIRGCAEKMGRVPTFAEVRRATKLSKHAIRKNFISYARALGECGLERRGPGYEAAASALFLDWAGLVRTLGKLPTMAEYEMHGSYSVRPLVRRYGGWTHVPAGMLEYARKEKLEGEWADVLDVVARHREKAAELDRTSGRRDGPGVWANETSGRRRVLADQYLNRPVFYLDQPVYGTPSVADAAEPCSDERAGRGVSIWVGGAGAGVYGDAAASGVSGLRSDARG